RAPAAPQAAFAVESLIDELAERLGMDPLELRLRNVVVVGDTAVSGQEFKVFGARECLERVGEHPLWMQRGSLPDGEGVGVAIGWWPGGYEPAAAVCRLDSDGHLTIVTGAADMTGVETTFAAIAADAFGMSPDHVRVNYADTSNAPLSSPRSRRASSSSTWPPRSSRSPPRTSRSSTAPSSPSACPRRRCRS